MMFWFCKQSTLNVYCFTTKELAFNFSKPMRASRALPSWFKELPTPSLPTDGISPLWVRKNLKSCPAIVNLYSSGFMLPLWSDLHIEASADQFRYQFIDGESNIAPHPVHQFGGCTILNEYMHAKLQNPWVISTDKKINMMYTAPVWNNFGYGDIVVAPGSYNTASTAIEANINLFIKRSQERKIYTLLLGQPLVHVVPITEKRIKLHYELITEKELRTLKAKSPLWAMDGNRYRRSEKLCPHA